MNTTALEHPVPTTSEVAWIDPADVAATVKRLIAKATIELSPDVVAAFERAVEQEQAPLARDIYRQLLENVRVARETGLPTCQDTGMVIAFARLGNRVLLREGTLKEAIEAGVREAYAEYPLRKSVVGDPLRRVNTGDNTPIILHIEQVPGNDLELTILPKGFGGENTSRIQMFPPSAGWEGIKAFVVETVKAGGPNSCPPVVVGVGVGGDFEYVAQIAKRALLRDIGTPHTDPQIARWEQELLEAVNAIGLGPQGLGGTVTAMAVHMEVYPTHIGSLPVAVNIGCNAYRHGSAVLHGERHA